MKSFSERIFSSKKGVGIFLAGVISLLFPHISGWSDIVFPQFALIWFFPYLLWKISFASFLGLSFINFVMQFFLKRAVPEKLLTFGFLITLLILFLSIYPNFLTEEYLGVDQRVTFFAVGGQARIYMAGGMEHVRNNALGLLSEKTDDEGFVASGSWSDPLRKLGAYAIRIDKPTQSVIIYIPRADLFDPDQFVYLITSGQEPSISVLQNDSFRYWKLGDGVYFFQTW